MIQQDREMPRSESEGKLIACRSRRIARDRAVSPAVADEISRLNNLVTDLELSLEMANQHNDLLQEHFCRVNETLATEVRERQSAELKLHRLLEAIQQEKTDLEIMLQILIEQGDHSAAEGEQARIDGLTRIANRRRLDEHLLAEWDRHRVLQQPLSFLLCDVDYFKAYNDCFGHQAGDDCLKAVGERISQSLRRNDLVARYGGEEFAVVLPEADMEAALRIAERTRSAIAGAGLAQAPGVGTGIVTISIGVSCAIPLVSGVEGPSSLIQEADRRLYIAKSRGRNRVEPQMQVEVYE